MARDMPEPYTYPPRGTCQERHLWTRKEFEVALHPVVGLELRVGDAEKFPQALGLESLGQFFWKTASRIRVSQPQRRMEVTITYAIATANIIMPTLYKCSLFTFYTCHSRDSLLVEPAGLVMEWLRVLIPTRAAEEIFFGPRVNFLC